MFAHLESSGNATRPPRDKISGDTPFTEKNSVSKVWGWVVVVKNVKLRVTPLKLGKFLVTNILICKCLFNYYKFCKTSESLNGSLLKMATMTGQSEKQKI